MNSLNSKEKKAKLDFKSPVISAVITMLVLVLVFGISNTNFFKLNNLTTILLNASVIGIYASGITMVLISGGIDLSTAATSAVAVMLMGMLYQNGVPIIAGIIIGIIAAGILGFINGILIAVVHLPPLMVTIAGQLVYRALAQALTNTLTITIASEGFSKFGRMYILGIPISVFYMIAFMIVMNYVLKHTAFGRRVFAVGGNMQASFYSGINIQKTQLAIYTIMGVISGFAGMVAAAQSAAAAPTTMTAREFDFISPCFFHRRYCDEWW